MSKQQREELLTQIETFMGMGLLSLLVAVLNWHGNVKGGWGNTAVDWVGRSIDSLILIVAVVFSLRRKKITWLRRILIGLGAVAILWFMLWVASITFTYLLFLGIFILFLLYSIILCGYYLYSDLTGKVCSCLDRVVNITIFARQIIWVALLLVGTLATWSEVRNHVQGLWIYIVLIVCLLVVGFLIYGWLRGIYQDRINLEVNHKK